MAALRDKYAELKRLRDAAASGQPQDPRRALAALARRFPGALRELDELPIARLEARLCELQALVQQGAAAPQWVRLQIGYHAWMRVALDIRRRAAAYQGAARAQAIVRELADNYRPEPDEPELAALDQATVEAILKPAGGRLNPWVFARVAQLHGVEPSQVERALFLSRAEKSGAR